MAQPTYGGLLGYDDPTTMSGGAEGGTDVSIAGRLATIAGLPVSQYQGRQGPAMASPTSGEVGPTSQVYNPQNSAWETGYVLPGLDPTQGLIPESLAKGISGASPYLQITPHPVDWTQGVQALGVAAPFIGGASGAFGAAGSGGADLGAMGADSYAAAGGAGAGSSWTAGAQLAGDAGLGGGAAGAAGYTPSQVNALSNITIDGGGNVPWQSGGGSLDTIGNMVQNVPEGMDATTYARSLGYPSADAWLASGAGTGAAVGAGAASGGGNPIAQTSTNAGDATYAQMQAGQLAHTASPSILDVIGKFMQSGGIAGQLGQALGLSPTTSAGLGGLWSAGSGIYGLYQSDQLKKQAAKYAQQADPFGPYRSGYAQQLQGLMNDPSGVTKLPGYEAGLQAVQRSMAAQGYNGSGNMMAALSKYGGDFYNNAVSQLSGLAGANINPANGAMIGLQGSAGGANLALNSLGLIGKGLVGQRT